MFLSFFFLLAALFRTSFRSNGDSVYAEVSHNGVEGTDIESFPVVGIVMFTIVCTLVMTK